MPLYSETGPTSAIIAGLNSAFSSASEYSKFEGTIAGVGYFVGFRGSTEGKAAAILLCPSSTYIIHRNWKTSAGNWTMFSITS